MRSTMRVVRCKSCGRKFSYDKKSSELKKKKGESELERCEDCRRFHGEETAKAKVPYFRTESKKKRASLRFGVSRLNKCFRGKRRFEEKKKEVDSSKFQFGITDEDILTLYDMLENNQVVVVVSPTGSGKSTYIPYRLLVPPDSYKGDLVQRLINQGQIMITEPLTSAVERIPEFIGKDMLGSEVGPGHIIGLRHGSQSGGEEGERYDRWNIAAIVTDGSLRNWIREGRLGRYSLVMVDEAHQRSCNIETILMLLKNELVRYPNLRVIISSATVDAESFHRTFEEVGIKGVVLNLDVSTKRKHNQFIHFWGDEKAVKGCNCWLCANQKKRKLFWRQKGEPPKEFEVVDVITDFVLDVLENTQEGSILVFLHGEAVIEETARILRTRIGTEEIPVIPVYRVLGEKEVARRFDDKRGKRRVIIATNIAETSHTLDDVLYVIDSGLIKEAQWDPDIEALTLLSCYHSQDGCRQRWGRVGRTQDGYVYTLYTKEQFDKFKVHTSPEIARANLEDVFLTLKASGISETEKISWLVKEEEFEKKTAESKRNKWLKEKERSKKALENDGMVDEDGLISEKALEIFYIPRPSKDIALFALAEEKGCLFEMMIVFCLAMNREGELRIGANLYTPGTGLFLWDSEWEAETKAKAWALQQGLKTGCKDDLEFIFKLAFCFWKAKELGIAQEWAKYHFLNCRVFEEVFASVEEILDNQYRRTAGEEKRVIDPASLEKIRCIFESIWSQRIVELKVRETIIYPKKGKIKAISPNCAGNWKNGQKAIIVLIDEEEIEIGGYRQKVATGCFLSRLPSENECSSFEDFFIDQIFPVGSKVTVKEKSGKFFIEGIKQYPFPIKVRYQDSLEVNGSASGNYKETVISYSKPFLKGEPKTRIEGIWLGEKKNSLAEIAYWDQENGRPIAVLMPLNSLNLEKRKKLKVRIHKVIRDFWGRKGFVFVKTSKGCLIPVDFCELSISPFGPGLEITEGKDINLLIKITDGKSQLSNLKNIMDDLRVIKKEITESEKTTKVSERNFVELPGIVVDIEEDREQVIVVVSRKDGIVHPFEVTKDYVPGNDIRNLSIGQEVNVQLFNKTGKDTIPLTRFTKQELCSIPRNLAIDEIEKKLLVPFCLEDKDFYGWSVRTALLDFIKRHSWQYCLSARIRTFFEAKAKFPTFIWKNGEYYTKRDITGMFFGRGGRNIKLLLKKEDASVDIKDEMIIVTSSSSKKDVDIVCRRISKWFEIILDFELKWER